MVPRSIILAGILAAAPLASNARAQAVTGLGEDATLPPAGNLRLTVASGWAYFDQRFGNIAGPGGAALEPLGAMLTLDAVGATQLRVLRPVEDSLAALSGIPGARVSLGRTTAQMTGRITAVPLTLEAGISRWLSAGATVPIVRTSSTIFFGANRTGTAGNLGINPAVGSTASLAADTAFAQQVIRSAAAVQRYCGGAGAGTARCAGSAELAAAAARFGRSVATVYGGGLFVPLRGSTLQAAIDSRGSAFRDALNAFAAVANSGVPAVAAAGPVAAGAPLSTSDLRTVLSDPAFGVGLQPIGTAVSTHVGDVEVATRIGLLDSFGRRGEGRFVRSGLNARLSMSVGYRFATGQGPDPDNLTAIPTGAGSPALLVGGYTDIAVGRHFWASLAARSSFERPTAVTVRYVRPGEVFPVADQRMTVQRQLGNLVAIETTPRWEFNDFLTVGVQYAYISRAAATFSASGLVPADMVAGVVLDGLELATAARSTQQRFGGGIAFSNARAVQRGESHFPFDVSFMHSEVVRGSNAPKLILDEIRFRLYRPLHR